ncbi:MAG: DUF6531 domain-containing protein, partial [Anaerolineaceae bacterium]|nr:DUF6531 domain-containing protein [Anaerolineaceae bacterium]
MGAIATCVNGLAADPVNTQTGGFSYGVSDLSIPTEAGPLALNLEYSSTAMETEVDLYNPSVGDTSLGYGWTHNHDIGLRFDTVPDPDEVIFKGASANQYTFYDNGGGTYTPYAGITATLSYDSGTSTYTLEDAGHNLYEFDSAGKLLTWTNAGGQAFAYSYGTNGLLDRVTGPDGVRYLDFDYDLQDRLTLVSDHTARSASITYDANNNVETFTDAMGKIWHYGYDTSHLMTTVQVEDPANPGVLIDRTRNLYDTQGRVVCQQEGDEHPLVTSYQEVTGGNLCKQADGNIAVATSFSYDNVQSRTVIKDPNDNLSMDYHNRSRRILTDEEDALGNRTVNTVDDNFRPVSMKDAEGNPTEIEWSPDGYNLTQVTNADNKTTQLGYDSLNNLTSMTDPDNNITNYYYDDSNYPTQISEIEYSPDGGTTWLATTFTYYGPGDVAPGKLSQVTDPVGNDTFYTYDQYGQVLTITTGYGLDERTTSFTYDTLGRTVEIVDPAGIITRTEFDAAGRVTRAIENCKENYPTDCMSSYPQNYEENGKIYNVATSYTYDFQGNQIAVTDTQGVVTRTYYDSYNRAVTTVRNLTGQSIGTSTPPARGSGAGDENIRMDYTFDTVGNRIATTDPLGVVNRTYFNEIDQPVKIVQNMTGNIGDAAPPAYNPAYPDQNVFTDTIYNKNGSMIATTDVNGITTRTYYDVLNRPATIVQNLTGQAISETVPPVRNSANATENLRTDIYYDARGNAIATEDPAGNITRTYYDDINRPVTVVQNLTGQSISTSTPPARGSTPDENIRTDTTYDENGNVILTEDPQGRLTKNVYNEFDQLSTVTVNFLDGQPQNHQNEYNIVSTYTYDSQGNRVSITDTAGVVTYFEYDGLGRVTAEVQNYVNGGPNDSETNLRTEYTFNAVGNKETAAAADGVVTKYEYDSLRRITAETHNYVNGGPVDHQTNLRTQYGYDAAGNRVSLTDANNHTTGYSYDGLNRMTVETDANNHSTTRVYDGAGNLQSQTDANNLTTSYGYDALNRMTSITDSLNNVTQYGYDVLGNKTSMTDANGVITTYEYDAVGRLEAVVENYVDGSTADHETNVRTEYGYDMGGNLTSILDGNNHSRSFVYDNLNRLTDEINALNHTTSYTFDAAGNMVLKTEANGQDIDHSYDALNRIVGIDYNGDQVNDVTYTYDLSGQVDFTTDSMGTTDWTYDPIGRITSVVDPFSSTVSYGYDAVGNRTSLAYPDTKSVTYAYDPANRLEQITDWNSEITSYTYDDADRLTGMSLPNGISAGYTYDDASRITDISYTKTEEVFAQYAYTYDNAGNRTQMQEMIQLAGQSLPVVEVTVKDNLDQPVAGFTVHALDDVVETGVSAVTDDAGIARISLPDGNYRFRVQRDGTEFHSDAINHCTVPTCTEASIELSILAGTVVDDLGSPAPGIQLSVYDDAGDTGLKGITDALGLVELAVPDGCYQLYSEEEGQQVFSNEDCTAPAHAATLTIDLADALTTTVTAEDDAGTPQENVPVYAFAGEVYTGLTGASDVNGEVTLAIPEDDYRYAPDLPAGSPLADVQITVTVEDTSSAPQAGLTVFALSGSDYNDYKTYAGRSDVTDAAGQVVLTLPQIGQYRFRVKDGSQSYYSDLTALCDPLTCSAVTVTIPGTGGDVVVTATDGLGQAIADNMVYAFDEDTYTGIFAETDVNGQATLSLPEGDYRFRTEVDEKFFFSDTVNHCTPPTCTSAQIAMPAVHAVTVSVQDEAANPQQDVVVYAFEGATYAEMSYTGNSGKSDELGEVNFELPAGNYWFAYKQGDAAVDAGETAVCVLPGCTTSTLTTTQNGTTTYVYDPLNRLTGATEVGTATREYGYTYDAVGNRLTKTIDSTTVNYGYDIANRLTSVDSVTYTWDNNGNLLSDGVFTYTYDAMNRLASATDGVDTYAYAYNASGDRLQQTVNAVPTNYTLDLAAGLAQVLDDGTNAYLYGRDRIAQEDTNGMLYFIPDALGSVR